jgi:hypothetical protein
MYSTDFHEKMEITDDNVYLGILHILFDLPGALKCYSMLLKNGYSMKL